MKARHGKPNWRVVGTATTKGGTYDRATVVGEAIVTDSLNCRHFKVMGTCEVGHDMYVDNGDVFGTLTVSGDVRGDTVRVFGELQVQGNCTLESFTSKGAFEVDGLLNAGQIEIQLYGPSRVREIGCETIRVKPHRHLFSKSIRRLTADVIEGDDIELTYTKANVVRGRRVRIGVGCEIDVVEYQTTFQQHKAANVGQHTQV